MQDLAEEIGRTAGGIYHYFAGKDELLAAICAELMTPLLDAATGFLSEQAPPTTHLRRLLRFWVSHVITHRDHMVVFQQERHVIAKGVQWREARAARKEFEGLLDGILARVEADQGLALSDRRVVLAAVLGMVNHTPQWYQQRGRLSAEDVADGYFRLILAPGCDADASPHTDIP